MEVAAYDKGKQMFEDSQKRGGNLTDRKYIYMFMNIIFMLERRFFMDLLVEAKKSNKEAFYELVNKYNHIFYNC